MNNRRARMKRFRSIKEEKEVFVRGGTNVDGCFKAARYTHRAPQHQQTLRTARQTVSALGVLCPNKSTIRRSVSGCVTVDAEILKHKLLFDDVVMRRRNARGTNCGSADVHINIIGRERAPLICRGALAGCRVAVLISMNKKFVMDGIQARPSQRPRRRPPLTLTINCSSQPTAQRQRLLGRRRKERFDRKLVHFSPHFYSLKSYRQLSMDWFNSHSDTVYPSTPLHATPFSVCPIYPSIGGVDYV
ncbi:hypothetical protein EVAR_53756_1 [Eumeta japonica]|uniref:Uncharacterized protein n=1 Tax=Eumeta variegata TaxID=151549 RepID=A0A4C1Z9R7_EUMVA|nr:hypothetical protein EVAR_53756_1 [Eumeta japonica]